MTSIINSVTSHLYESDEMDIVDYDDIIDDIRVCVSFDAYMDAVNIVSSEVLDDDWDLLYEDTAVLTSRLRPIVEEYIDRYNHSVDAQRYVCLNKLLERNSVLSYGIAKGRK